MKLNLPKRKKAKSPSHHRSKRQEEEIAKRIQGRKTKNSGAGLHKMDVRNDVVRIEAKTTKNKSYRVTLETLEKLEADAFGSDQIPILEVELQLGKQRFCVVPGWAMDEIEEFLRAKND